LLCIVAGAHGLAHPGRGTQIGLRIVVGAGAQRYGNFHSCARPLPQLTDQAMQGDSQGVTVADVRASGSGPVEDQSSEVAARGALDEHRGGVELVRNSPHRCGVD
jgi:hypothetical protein